MILTVTVNLLTGSYDAGDVTDKRDPEWPPHPARLFCALVAAARSVEERAALRWLETQPAPCVCAAHRSEPSQSQSYVVVNELSSKGGNLVHPGRSNQLRTRARSFPHVPTVRFVWQDTEADIDLVRILDNIARRVPYLGRSTGISLISATATTSATAPIPTPETGGAAITVAGPVVPDPGEGTGAWVVYEPCDLEDSQMSLRVPYPGYLDDLDELFAADRSTWQTKRMRGYRIRQDQPASSVAGAVRSVYEDVVVFRFAGLRPQGRLAPLFTESLRRAVLAIAGDDAPGVLHGHDANGRPHVAFLALPHVGSDYADGHLLGLAVAIPELPAGQRREVLAAVLGLRQPNTPKVVVIRVAGIGEVELLYQPGLIRPWGASPQRWRRGSQRWVTATPVILDRFPRRPGQEADIVLGSTRMVGLPDPVDIQVSPEPLIAGAVRLRPPDLPKQVRGRLFRHVSLTFDRPVAGPLLLGAGRYLGVGLFAPVSDDKETSDAADS